MVVVEAVVNVNVVVKSGYICMYCWWLGARAGCRGCCKIVVVVIVVVVVMVMV